ncbi:MAG: hypothetical protein DI616_13185 [Paracoccus denitrificans]|uniref:Uncharacterized protein n=1 Tax=Paracoccus denitrificans TaxID=266 RepID=A0A533I5X5_PARDE|nr:MAG: hypothetical protein DI616_13185 [Paracoccus denitrificans]
MRLDPLTQTVTAPASAAPLKPVQLSVSNVPPTMQAARFVTAADGVTGTMAYESAYAAVRVRRRMNGQIAGLAKLDGRLADASTGLRSVFSGGNPEPGTQAVIRTEARMAELRAAAAALNLAISGARSDVAVVLKQMRAELGAAIEALAQNSAAQTSSTNGALANASGNGEALIRRANGLGLKK